MTRMRSEMSSQVIEHHYKDLYPLQYTSKMGSFGRFIGCVAKAQHGDTLKTAKGQKTRRTTEGKHFP